MGLLFVLVLVRIWVEGIYLLVEIKFFDIDNWKLRKGFGIRGFNILDGNGLV